MKGVIIKAFFEEVTFELRSVLDWIQAADTASAKGLR